MPVESLGCAHIQIFVLYLT